LTSEQCRPIGPELVYGLVYVCQTETEGAYQHISAPPRLIANTDLLMDTCSWRSWTGKCWQLQSKLGAFPVSN